MLSANNLSTATVIAKSQTESALVLTTLEFKDFKLSVNIRTDKHMRQNSLPNPWGVARTIWRWNDNTHFYYLLVKTMALKWANMKDTRDKFIF